MALSGKHAVALNTIRVRGVTEIEPGSVFEHESSDEANRLFSIDVIREATKDEADLYEARVKEGSIPRSTLSGNPDAPKAAPAAETKPAAPVAPKGAKKDDDL